jgi:putative thioredoxin
MANMINPYIIDGNRGNFQDAVLNNSNKGPVMVNYWTDKAGPCLRLWPVLEKLTSDYAGRFLLVNINTDNEGTLAREYGVTSVPTVKLFLQGQVVDQIHGAESEIQFRRMLDRHLARESDTQLAGAVEAYRQGGVEQAFAMLDSLMIQDPENPRIFLAYAKLLMREKHFQRVVEVIDASGLENNSEEAAILQANAIMLATAEQAPMLEQLLQALAENADEPDLLFKLAATQLTADDYAAAMENLLRIMQLDKNYRNGIAGRSMRAIFAMLGRDQPLVRDFRQRMMDLN